MAIESRGRPSESPAVRKTKYELVYPEFPSKPELGFITTFYFDDAKSKNGAWKVESTPPKGYKHPKVKIEKGKAYGKMPVVMVFKTSNRSNAKVKMKVWNNENIDYITSAKKLVGVPDNHILLELGVGKSFIEKWQSKYNL
jgi:hypothetical protein|tara:strand:- start:727 stop:1149 length:423 start_codon:yes stop_codon:yes gene_type:complete